MVMARLHVICGNCGNGSDFRLDEHKDIHCENCGTIHFLSEVAEKNKWKSVSFCDYSGLAKSKCGCPDCASLHEY